MHFISATGRAGWGNMEVIRRVGSTQGAPPKPRRGPLQSSNLNPSLALLSVYFDVAELRGGIRRRPDAEARCYM